MVLINYMQKVLSIKSALDVDYQLHALSALRSGIESYDRRHGWRGQY